HLRTTEFFLGGLDNLGWIDNFAAGFYRVVGHIMHGITGNDYGFFEKAEGIVSGHRELANQYKVDEPDAHKAMTDPNHRSTIDAVLEETPKLMNDALNSASEA